MELDYLDHNSSYVIPLKPGREGSVSGRQLTSDYISYGKFCTPQPVCVCVST
jgi:hypothetical protein